VPLAKVSRYLLILFPLGVLVTLLFSLLATERIDFTVFGHLSLGYLALALFFVVAPWGTHFLRLLIWTRFLDRRFRSIDLLKAVLGNELGAAISPTAIGGGPVKAGILAHLGLEPGKAVSLMLLTTIEDWSFLLLAMPLALTVSSAWGVPFFQQLSTLLLQPWALAVIVFSIFVTVVIVRRHQRAMPKPGTIDPAGIRPGWLSRSRSRIATTLGEIVAVYSLVIRRGKLRFLACALLAALGMICRYSVITALVAGFGMPVDPVRFFALHSLVYVTTLFFPSPGATVGAEASFFLIYSEVISNEVIAATALAWRFLSFYFINILAVLLFYLIALRSPSKRIRNGLAGATATGSKVSTDTSRAV